MRIQSQVQGLAVLAVAVLALSVGSLAMLHAGADDPYGGRPWLLIVAVAALTLGCIVLALIWLIWHGLLQPLARLRQSVQRMAAGEPPSEAEVHESPELRELAHAVRGMALHLMQAHQGSRQEAQAREAAYLQLRTVLDHMPAMVAYVERSQVVTLANSAYLAWNPRGDGQVVGHVLSDLHGQASYLVLAPRLAQALEGEAVSFEAEIGQGMQRRAMQVTFVPDTGPNGDTHGVFAMMADVTPLRRTEQRMRDMLDASPLGMCLCRPSGVCEVANAVMRRLMTDAGLGIQQGWLNMVHPADTVRLQQVWADLLVQGGRLVTEFRCRPRLGQSVPTWVCLHAVLQHEADGEPIVAAILEEVTHRHRLEEDMAQRTEALARSNEELERFAYVASHDLQEPIRMVTSFGRLLMGRHLSDLDPEAREFVHQMVDAGQRAQRLIHDLLSLARLDSQPRVRQAVSLDGVMRDVLDEHREAIRQQAAVVRCAPLPTVWADPVQIAQVLSNLLSNALKFRADRTPEIELSAMPQAQGWCIVVRDNGIGIDPRFHDRIFAIFQRLHPRDEYGGTGLGLAICKKVMERHGGRIQVQSTPGEGAAFLLHLPQPEGMRPSVAALDAPGR